MIPWYHFNVIVSMFDFHYFLNWWISNSNQIFEFLIWRPSLSSDYTARQNFESENLVNGLRIVLRSKRPNLASVWSHQPQFLRYVQKSVYRRIQRRTMAILWKISMCSLLDLLWPDIRKPILLIWAISGCINISILCRYSAVSIHALLKNITKPNSAFE